MGMFDSVHEEIPTKNSNNKTCLAFFIQKPGKSGKKQQNLDVEKFCKGKPTKKSNISKKSADILIMAQKKDTPYGVSNVNIEFILHVCVCKQKLP